MFFYNDIPQKFGMNFQMPATNNAEGIVNLHNDMLFFIFFIILFVSSFMFFSLIEYYFSVLKNKNFYFFPYLDLFLDRSPLRFAQHFKLLEIIWTLIPTLILFSIGLPSIFLLYSLDEVVFSPIILKVIGHQWYWSYEYTFWTNIIKKKFINGSKTLTFDSYMRPYEDLNSGDLRLLSVDNVIVLPTWINIRILATSDDVIHSWAIPSLGVKVDAVPGRLNQIFFLLKRPGIFFGQCSEICGTNHGFMPICLKSIYPEYYLNWCEQWLTSLNLLDLQKNTIENSSVDNNIIIEDSSIDNNTIVEDKNI